MNINKVNHIVHNLENKSDLEKLNIVKKLHRQFGHTTARPLKLLLKNAGIVDRIFFTMIEDVSTNCDICKRYKRTPPRPVVSLPLAQDFNDTVAMDLKIWDLKRNIYILYLIDVATCFSKAAIIHDKDPETVIDKIMLCWIGTGLGYPRRFLCDNGGEFANEKYRDMCENLNITPINTAAESPFSNGLCERNHAVIDKIIQKLICEKPELKLSTALSWAIHAKNNLMMVGGYSPYQLVYGRNPNIPSVLVNEPPALENKTISRRFADHLYGLHKANEAFIQAQSCEKISRALLNNIKASETVFVQGDEVYFKRDGKEEWRGPGTIVGMKNKILSVQHGNWTCRVHVNRCIHKNKRNVLHTGEKNEQVDKSTQTSDTTDLKHTGEKPFLYNKVDKNAKVTTGQYNVVDSDCEEDTIEEPVNNEIAQINNEDIQINNENDDSFSLPKKGSHIKYLPKNSNEWISAQVLGRGGKIGGKYANWMNMKNCDGNTQSIDMENYVDKWNYEFDPNDVH